MAALHCYSRGTTFCSPIPHEVLKIRKVSTNITKFSSNSTISPKLIASQTGKKTPKGSSRPVTRPVTPSVRMNSSNNNGDHLVTVNEAVAGCTTDLCYGVGHIILGIDIGGTTIKAGLVDTHAGLLVSDKYVVDTPQPATPEAVACALTDIVQHFKWTGAVGVGIPAVVRTGIVHTAANIDKRWIGSHAEEIFEAHSGVKMCVVNDADAAGYAEMAFGAGAGEAGTVMMLTFGTGIGTAMFVEGILVPNLELGHLEIDGDEAERQAAGVLVRLKGWTWDEWAAKAQWYLSHLEALLWPGLFIIGGGVSNAHDEWLHKVDLPNKTPIKVAKMKNDAGIIGAAMAALARAAFEKTRKPQQVQEYVNAP